MKKKEREQQEITLVGNLGLVMFSLQSQGLFLSVVRRIHTIPLYLPPALVQTCAQRSSSNPAAPKNKKDHRDIKIRKRKTEDQYSL